jgi:hypothetical protein
VRQQVASLCEASVAILLIIRIVEPSPSLSTTTSHKNALLVTFAPVSLSVDFVELFRSIAFGGRGGGRGDIDRGCADPDLGL